MKIHVVDATNLTEKLMSLNHHPSDIDQITDAVNQGKVVVIPQSDISIGDLQWATGFAIIDPTTGNLLSPLEPVNGSVEDPTRAFEVLSQRVMGALATMLDNPTETHQFIVFLRESSVS